MSAGPRKAGEFAAPRQVVLFDGVCGLCNRFVQYVIVHDTNEVLHFAPLQGAAAARVLARHQMPNVLDSVVFVEHFGEPQERVSTRAQAVLRILALLGPQLRWVGLLRYFPNAVLNLGYWFVAKTRYGIFGRSEACMVPTAAQRRRFLE